MLPRALVQFGCHRISQGRVFYRWFPIHGAVRRLAKEQLFHLQVLEGRPPELWQPHDQGGCEWLGCRQ